MLNLRIISINWAEDYLPEYAQRQKLRNTKTIYERTAIKLFACIINIQMKINFDQLFGLKNSESQSHFKNKSHLSQASTSYGLDKSTKLAFIEPNIPPQRQEESFNVNLPRNKQNETMRILQNNKSQVPKYSWYKQSRFDDPQTNVKTQKQKQIKEKIMTKAQASKLADKLTKRQNCRNRGCIETVNEGLNKKIRQQNLPHGAPRKHERTLSETVQLIKMNPSELHERLYREHKSREFRSMQLMLQYEEKRIDDNQIKIYENEQFTEKYISFYERLDDEIQKREKRRQFYDNNIIINEEVITFEPNITASGRSLFSTRKKPTINPKKQKKQIKGRAEMIKFNSRQSDVMDRLNRSFESTLNKSLEIVREKQEGSILKILSLFEENGYFVLRPELIEQLKQVQFQILLPLIIKMQKQESIPIQVFEAKLRKYFESLPKVDKYALRDCQKERQRAKKIKIRQTKTINTSLRLNQSIMSKSYKRPNKGTDYLDKIKQFI